MDPRSVSAFKDLIKKSLRHIAIRQAVTLTYFDNQSWLVSLSVYNKVTGLEGSMAPRHQRPNHRGWPQGDHIP